MKTEIRRATKDDLNDILKLNDMLFAHEKKYDVDDYVPKWSFGKVNEEYFDDLIKNHFVVVAVSEKEVVGYLAGSIYLDNTYSFYEGVTCELENIFVREEYRKCGLGTKMVNSFFEWCKEKHAKRCFVTAMSVNKNALEFYEDKGFENSTITFKKIFD